MGITDYFSEEEIKKMQEELADMSTEEIKRRYKYLLIRACALESRIRK